MRVHVTGGSGYLGGHVIPLLVAADHEVTALVRSTDAAGRVVALGAEPLAGDLDEPSSVDAAMSRSRAEVLVNLASLGFAHAPTIVAAAEDAGIPRAVFVSTTSIFTRLPAATKTVRTAAEATIGASALEWTIIRPTMIYGTPDDRNMSRLLRLLRRTSVVPLPGGGDGLQQPVHVDDLAEAIVACLARPQTIGHAYDVAGPEPLTLRQVVLAAAAAVGRSPKPVAVPFMACHLAAKLYEAVAPRPRIRAEQIARLGEDKAFDIGPARRDLGFNPRSFVDGVRQEAELLV